MNQAGDFAIALIDGSKKKGYQFLGSHANRAVWLGTFQLMTRAVLNDGNWIEIKPEEFNVASAFHVQGYITQFGVGYQPVVSPYTP